MVGVVREDYNGEGWILQLRRKKDEHQPMWWEVWEEELPAEAELGRGWRVQGWLVLVVDRLLVEVYLLTAVHFLTSVELPGPCRRNIPCSSPGVIVDSWRKLPGCPESSRMCGLSGDPHT